MYRENECRLLLKGLLYRGHEMEKGIPSTGTFSPIIRWNLKSKMLKRVKYTVLPATQQRQRSRHNPSRSWYSIYRPLRDERLSWPEPADANILLGDITWRTESGNMDTISGGFVLPMRSRDRNQNFSAAINIMLSQIKQESPSIGVAVQDATFCILQQWLLFIDVLKNPKHNN